VLPLSPFFPFEFNHTIQKEIDSAFINKMIAKNKAQAAQLTAVTSKPAAAPAKPAAPASKSAAPAAKPAGKAPVTAASKKIQEEEDDEDDDGMRLMSA